MDYYSKLLGELLSSGNEIYRLIDLFDRLISEHPLNAPFKDAVKMWGASCACVPLNEAEEFARLWVVGNLLRDALRHIEWAKEYSFQKSKAEKTEQTSDIFADNGD